MKRDSKKIIQEAVKSAINGEAIISEGPITWAKSVGAGIKGAGQNVVGNFRANRAKSYMDQFAKKAQDAFTKFSSKAQNVAQKMQQSSNQTVSQTGQQIAQSIEDKKQKLSALTQDIQTSFPTGVGSKASVPATQAPATAPVPTGEEGKLDKPVKKSDELSAFKKWAADEYGVEDVSKLGVSVQKDLIDQYKEFKKGESEKLGQDVQMRKHLKGEPEKQKEVPLSKNDEKVLQKKPVAGDIDQGKGGNINVAPSPQPPQPLDPAASSDIKGALQQRQGRPQQPGDSRKVKELNLKDLGLSKEQMQKIASVVKSPEEMVGQPIDISNFSQKLEKALQSGDVEAAKSAAGGLLQSIDKPQSQPPSQPSMEMPPEKNTSQIRKSLKTVVDKSIGNALTSPDDTKTSSQSIPVDTSDRPELVRPDITGTEETLSAPSIPPQIPQTRQGTVPSLQSQPIPLVNPKLPTPNVKVHPRLKPTKALPQMQTTEAEEEPIISMADFMARSSDDPEIARQAKEKIDSERETEKKKRPKSKGGKKKVLIIDRDFGSRKQKD